MKTDYITNSTTLPPSLAFPRSLLAADVRFTAKEVYVILLDMALHSEADIHTDEQGRRYLVWSFDRKGQPLLPGDQNREK